MKEPPLIARLHRKPNKQMTYPMNEIFGDSPTEIIIEYCNSIGQEHWSYETPELSANGIAGFYEDPGGQATKILWSRTSTGW